MSEATPPLLAVWLAMFDHLWQTSLVFGVVVLADRILRGAPARWTHALWAAALVKLFIPLVAIEAAMRAFLPARSAAAPAWAQGVAVTWATPSAEVGSRLARGDLVAISLTVAWLAVVTPLGIRLLHEYRNTSKTRRNACRLRLGETRRLHAALRTIGVSVDDVCVTALASMPAVIGVVRPVIHLPRRLLRELSVADVRAILVHEDAHRRRCDPAWLFARRVATVLFFFFPPVWWIARRLRETAEFACDEIVVQRGIPACDFARSLARTIRLDLERPPSLSVASADRGSLLMRRFRRLDTSPRSSSMLRTRLLLLPLILGVAFAWLAPLAVIAADDTETSEETEITKFPEVVRQVTPEFPEVHRERGIDGKVVLSAVVTKDGEVRDLVVHESMEECPECDRAALDALAQWEFQPAEAGGEPVELQILVPFRFVTTE